MSVSLIAAVVVFAVSIGFLPIVQHDTDIQALQLADGLFDVRERAVDFETPACCAARSMRGPNLPLWLDSRLRHWAGSLGCRELRRRESQARPTCREVVAQRAG